MNIEEQNMVLDYIKDNYPEVFGDCERLENVTVNGSTIQVSYRGWLEAGEVMHIELFDVLVWLYQRQKNLKNRYRQP